MPSGLNGSPGTGIGGDVNTVGGGAAGGAPGGNSGAGYDGGAGGDGGLMQKTWTLADAPFKPGDTITIHVPSGGGGGGHAYDPGLPGATASDGASGLPGSVAFDWS
jgi:hypothetical protein